jgi:hypothetical protein
MATFYRLSRPEIVIPASLIPWLPLGAVTLHLVEEFVWPGGFGDWYRSYRPERASSVTTSFLVRINALFVAMAFIAGLLAFRPYGVAIWLVVAGIGAANAAFHIWASVRTRTYSPGVATGCLLYLPLAVFGFVYFWRSGLAGPSVLIQAALIGPAFNIYSAWNHKRRARALLDRSSM